MLSSKIKWDQEATIREKFFFVIAVVGILFFFYNTLWEPRAKKLRDVRSQYNILAGQLKAMSKLIEAAHQQIARGKTAPEPDLGPTANARIKDILERHIASPIEEVNSTAALLQDGATRMRLKVKKMDVGDKVERPNYSLVPINAEVYGSYPNLMNYLDKLENIDRPIVVRSFKMQADKSVRSDLDMSMEVDLYLVKR